jgi:hydrocephalus-inducing protein
MTIASSPTLSPTTNSQPKVAQFTVTNNDPIDIGFEPLFVNESDLISDACAVLLSPGKSQTFKFSFLPREVKSYEWKLPFEVNNLFTITVTLRGEGIPLKLDALNESGVFNVSGVGFGSSHCLNVPKMLLLSPSLSQLLKEDDSPLKSSLPLTQLQIKQPTVPLKSSPAQPSPPLKSVSTPKQTAQQSQTTPKISDSLWDSETKQFLISNAISVLESGKRISFGYLRINQHSSRVVKIINRSPCPAKINISRFLNVIKDLSISLATGTQAETVIQPNQILEYKFTFSPKRRMREFSVPFLIEGAGCVIPVVSLTGACFGLEVKFDTPSLTFGSVMKGSKLIKTLLLQNSGLNYYYNYFCYYYYYYCCLIIKEILMYLLDGILKDLLQTSPLNLLLVFLRLELIWK